MAAPGGLDTVTNAHLIGLWLQLLATGAYFVYLPTCVFILAKRVKAGISPWLPAACFLIFVATVFDIFVTLIRAFSGYSVHGDTKPNPISLYADPSNTMSLMKNFVIIFVALVSDFIIVYRAWIVWNMDIWVMLVPFGLYLADIALGCWAFATLTQTEAGNAPILARVTYSARCFFIVTFVVNVLCSGMICYKIWAVQSSVPREFTRGRWSSSRVVEIIIECAGVYCAHLFMVVLLSCMKNNYFFMFLDPLPPVGAYVFTMLIVRGHENGMHKGTSVGSTTIRFDQRTHRLPTSTISVGVEIDLERVTDRADGFRRAPESQVYGRAGDGYASSDKTPI
ncbi:hypothetical protein C8Q70DRAFT_308755 [Cubamyces menziesii]|uniref:Transmembrane protein n=1 Tax=Trametes cubensis TaxID=1111947 RepID=A0AAD7U3K2_9APHY|nr:hypothetical protein C8Q70DRAFT_308755 [Cubamyces menziesii]KAJ8495759.1 hypothetical protein ONZ51_g1560 [Trametes cubensis]